MVNNIIQVEIPEQLCQQAQVLIQQGWANNLQEILTEALIQEDVKWGLHGDD